MSSFVAVGVSNSERQAGLYHSVVRQCLHYCWSNDDDDENNYRKQRYMVSIKSSPLLYDICWYFSNACRYLHDILAVKQSNKFIAKFCWNMSASDKIMLFQSRQPPFLSVRASCRTKRTVPGSTSSDSQTLRIWIRWTITTITSREPCWKTTINSGQSLRRLMS